MTDTLPSSGMVTKEHFAIEALRNAILSIEGGDPETALELIDGTRKQLLGLVFETNFPKTHTVVEEDDFRIIFPNK